MSSLIIIENYSLMLDKCNYVGLFTFVGKFLFCVCTKNVCDFIRLKCQNFDPKFFSTKKPL